jgi:hypothetical protein
MAYVASTAMADHAGMRKAQCLSLAVSIARSSWQSGPGRRTVQDTSPLRVRAKHDRAAAPTAARAVPAAS